MNKRPYGDRPDTHDRYKKHKPDHRGRQHGDRAMNSHGDRERPSDRQSGSRQYSYEDAVSLLPARTWKLSEIPAYTPFTVSSAGLPPLPEVKGETFQTAPFKHKSTVTYNRSAVVGDVTYERLEFIGDAQLEHIASRLIYERYSHLTAGQQSQLRELLVKNETLSEYAKAYGFEERVEVGDLERQRMQADAKNRGNKGFNKILGDSFEAYVAAVILSDDEHGFAIAEKWLTTLWAPKLLEAAARDRMYDPSIALLHTKNDADPKSVYNPTAKADLQKLILSGPGVALSYEPYQASIELKGDLLGQNRHFIAVYLTGYGYERKLLGKGEGKNKVEAGNWAAVEAMHGENKGIVDECAQQLEERREKKRAEREAAEKSAP
ncbi:Hypothetical protein R9X50_00492600 [Acrodontium crateriforme]|uniref:RNase III domain-containing protein n=1 Tax=Acrodontium crateriforme TaxID=150365 RepID=A0AAQ3RAH9_9PEZI|nr:Hypothetical protein R9X50_00492600 [Acrodontium crateriforme]